jgi:hypothetical protein
MDQVIVCITAIELILEKLDRPSLNSFQSEEELLELIDELRDEPRSVTLIGIIF